MSDLQQRGATALARWRREQPRLIAVDTETNTKSVGNKPDFDRLGDLPFCVTLSWDGQGEYIELDRDPQGADIVREILVGTPEWVFHNPKFDLHVLLNAGVIEPDLLAGDGWARIHDTELLSRLHYEHGVGDQGSHALKALSREYLRASTQEETELRKAKQTTRAATYADLPRKVLIPYAIEDARLTDLLYAHLRPFIDAYESKSALYELERELTVRLLFMEREGMGVDLARLRRQADTVGSDIEVLREAVRELVPDEILEPGEYWDPVAEKTRRRLKRKVVEFNPNSGQQLAEQLIARGIVLTRKTETGKWATDEEVLEGLAPSDELARLVLELRRLSKVRSTYLDPLSRKARTDGPVPRVAANFRVAAARTGRMACSEPNLQNIPRSDKRVRSCFVPKRDALLYFDYSNVEMVLAAAYSRDARLCQALREGADLHALTARLLFGYSETHQLTDTERQIGKVLNFQSLYGAAGPRVHAELLSRGIEMSEREAGALLTSFWASYPGLEALRTKLETTHNSRGFIQTYAGRHLHVDSDHKLINALIQGSAADLIEDAFVRVARYLEDNCEARLVCVIHDELQIDAPESEVAQLCVEVPRLMCDHPRITKNAPLTADAEISRTSWADKEPYVEAVTV